MGVPLRGAATIRLNAERLIVTLQGIVNACGADYAGDDAGARALETIRGQWANAADEVAKLEKALADSKDAYA